MAGAGEADVPQSPETQPADVREQLDQDLISHEGTRRSGDESGEAHSGYMGAVETEVTPVMPPVRGPDDLVSQGDGDDDIDPADELTPG